MCEGVVNRRTNISCDNLLFKRKKSLVIKGDEDKIEVKGESGHRKWMSYRNGDSTGARRQSSESAQLAGAQRPSAITRQLWRSEMSKCTDSMFSLTGNDL